jgi:FtsZ-binding cell division protein ZapB
LSNLVQDLKKEAQAVASLLATFRAIIGEDDELKDATIEGETSLYEMAQQCVDRIIECEIMIAGLKEKTAQFTARKQRFETQIEALRLGLQRALEAAEKSRLELPTATLYTSKGRDAIGRLDEELLPSKYFVTPEPQVDRAAVLKDLKDGIEVKGATLQNGAPVLNIKKK